MDDYFDVDVFKSFPEPNKREYSVRGHVKLKTRMDFSSSFSTELFVVREAAQRMDSQEFIAMLHPRLSKALSHTRRMPMRALSEVAKKEVLLGFQPLIDKVVNESLEVHLEPAKKSLFKSAKVSHLGNMGTTPEMIGARLETIDKPFLVIYGKSPDSSLQVFRGQVVKKTHDYIVLSIEDGGYRTLRLANIETLHPIDSNASRHCNRVTVELRHYKDQRATYLVVKSQAM